KKARSRLARQRAFQKSLVRFVTSPHRTQPPTRSPHDDGDARDGASRNSSPFQRNVHVRISQIWPHASADAVAVHAVAATFLLVISGGDLLVTLPLLLLSLLTNQTIVISTEAMDSLIVHCAVQRPPHFAFAFTVCP
ncbi:MAG TPA: hypothetical protein VIX90_07965, partial [Edaphobacter sp.]